MTQAITRLLLVAAVCLGVEQAAFGQGATDTSKGALSIEIKDAMQAMVPDAKVTVEGPLGAISGTSDMRGEANFTALTPGMYTVTVGKAGFSTAKVTDIELQATQKLSVPVALQVGQISQTVEVSGAADVVDVSSTTVESSINATEYANLPMGRNVTNLFYMAPGVAGGGGTGSANPSINGASGLENMYIIDGINDTDAGYGGFGVYSTNYGSLGTGVNFDFIKEVQIKTSGFDAQYGQAMGGVVNVITNSGGNQLHGSAYAYTNPGWAEGSYRQVNDVRSAAPQTEIWGQHQYDFGVNIGGPIKKDKFFWYGAFNPTFNHVEQQAPVGYSIRAGGPYDLEHRSMNWVGKLNYNIKDSQRLEATAYADPSKSPSAIQGPDPSGITGTALLRFNLDSVSQLDYGTRNWAVKYSGSFGPSTILSASFGWNHSYFTETPTTNTFQIRDYTQPTSTGALYTYVGGEGNLNNNQGDNKQYNLMATRTVNFMGGHTIDIGYSSNSVNYNSIQEYTGPQFALPKANGIAPGDVGKLVNGGVFYEYANRAVAGVTYPLVYRLIRGYYSSPNVSTLTKYQDAFLQDAWQVNKYLTIKAGVRWEQQRLDGNLNKYTLGGNWAPRVGFIVDPFGKGKTKFFGNYGLFFEKIPQDLAVRAMSAETSYITGYFLSLPSATSSVPVPGTTFSPSGVDPTIIYGGTKAAYEQQVSFGFEHEFGNSIVVRASFTDSTLKRGIEDTSGITAEQALAGAPQQYVITNPNVHTDIFHNATLCSSGPNCTNGSGYTDDSGALGADGKADGFPDMRRVYNALEISVDKRFSNKWSLTSNYRLAKLFGNYEGSFRNDNGQSDPNITSLFDFVNSPLLADQFKVGVLPTDRRSIINVFANYMVRSNINFGMGLTSQSGTPVSEFDAHPVYLNSGEIPVGSRGAEGRTPWGTYVDFRAGYDRKMGENRKLRFSVDMFNLFDRTTTVLFDQNHQLSGGTPNPDFLKPLTAHRPFRAQFSVRYEF